MHTSPMLSLAQTGLALGFCVIPPEEDGSKKPIGPWRTYEHRLPTAAEIQHWFPPTRQGIGVIAGAVSGNLEVLDFDHWDTYQSFLARAREQGLEALVSRIRAGYEEQTPKPGAHLLWRCSTIAGNLKLACTQTYQTLIETRGEGGFCILAPSHGTVHESGKPYRRLQGGWESIVTLTPTERDAILTLCRSFDESPVRPEYHPPPTQQPTQNGTRPGDLFAAATSWRDILEPHGWQWVRRIGEVDHWRRPGKQRDVSATTNYAGSDCFYCFSSSTQFDTTKGYQKFSVYTLLNHNGDYGAAAQALYKQGFRGERVTTGTQETSEKPSVAPPKKTRPSKTIISFNPLEVKEALTFISPATRETWLKIGRALASTRHTSAFHLWDEWSRKDEHYDEGDQYRTWETFHESGVGTEESVTLGTLFNLAKGHGWDREAGWGKGLLTTQQGNPIACPANMSLILRHTPLWRDNLKYNSFTGQAEYGEPQFDEYGRGFDAHGWSDTDDARLADYLRQEFRMAVMHLGHCTQAVDHVSRDFQYDPITTWLDALPEWDQEERLSYFFSDFCNMKQTPYTAFCGRSFFLSLVARAYKPGCQVDTVIVLEGAEGSKKTSLCRLVGGPWYKALSVSFETKDLFLALRRAWVAELAELDAFARSGQARIKSLLTMLSDAYRPAYARHEIDQPRRTVFVGTTNDPAYIVDPYGARRFFPVQVGDINLKAIGDSLFQLFAEARAAYRAGEQWWTDDPIIMAEANEVRQSVREDDPWEDKIADFITARPGNVILQDIFGSLCLDVPAERRTRAMQTRIGIILKTLGYVKKRRRTDSGDSDREYYYVRS